MRPRTADAALGARSLGARRWFVRSVQALLLATAALGFFWVVWLYAAGLRDPRYLDGWVLAGGMVLQVSFHIAIKTVGVSPKSATGWRRFHIFIGYLLAAVFVSHSNFSLPDTGFEWALWLAFLFVTLSGVFGTYLTWSLQAKRRIDEGVTYDRIPALRAELAREVQAVVAEADPGANQLALPGLPHDAWIRDLYTTHLRTYFRGPRNFASHLVGSQGPLHRLTDDIDNLSRYVDQQGREKLAIIKDLVVQKDRLDFAHVYYGLTRGWLFVHVPVTYALFVMSVVHVLVVYAFSAGTW